MKFSIERAALLKAVSQAQSVVERRNTIPTLANVLIEAEGSEVSFRATDLDIEVVDKATAQVERAGATTVSATMLHEIVRKLPDGALINLTADSAAGRLTVEAGRSNFSLATLPREDFPVMASSEYASNFSAPAPVLRRLFDKSKFAISTEETRYYLNGVYMHISDADGGKVLRCVATDGHRLARIDADMPDGAADMPGVIVPRSPIGYLLADHLLAWLPDPVTQILDLCSGSGCLGIIAAQLFPQAQVTLVELDDHAIAIARENIHRLGLDNRVTLRKGDVTKTLSFPQRFDLVLSNPPYVDAADMNQLPPEYLAEPHAGLAAGQDGLSIICPIINQLTNWLTPQGLFIGEVGASAPALMARYPRLPLFWPELPLGGEGVFLLEASGLTFHTGTTVEDAH